MKPQNHPVSTPPGGTRSAFSLMELLVVLTIIGILATIMMPAGQQVIKAMRKTQATKTATELRTAIMNYYSEYKRFPDFQDGVQDHFGDTLVETSGESGVVDALLAVPDSQLAEEFNRRGISFLSAKPAKEKGQSGVWKTDDGSYELYDPWGSYFQVLYDSNMDNAIKAPSKDDGAFDDFVITDVAVWSYGPDGEAAEPGSDKRNDDIYAY